MINKNSKRIGEITRKEIFSTAHKLYTEELSPEENWQLYNKCSNCHGHNYTISVTIKGEVDPVTGMVMNLNELKDIMMKNAIDKVDHKYLNEDVEIFKEIIPTAENIVWVIWQWLKPHLPNLYEIKLQETENNITIYRGE